jgi:mannitol-specific phosphotransferase system IIBC component
MSAESPSPSDPAAFEPTIDLTGGDETPVQAVGRVVGGMLLLIIGGLLALGFLAVYIAGAFIPGMADIQEIGGDWILYLAIFAFVGAVVGFGLVRRNRKARVAEAARLDPKDSGRSPTIT